MLRQLACSDCYLLFIFFVIILKIFIKKLVYINILIIFTKNLKLKNIEIMGNVEISIDFNDFEPMTIGQSWCLVFDFEKAIAIVRASKISNVQLRQSDNGGVMEWDNF